MATYNVEIKNVACGQVFRKEPTVRFRYNKDNVLQQAWAVTEYSGGHPIALTYEWQEIPKETDDEGDVAPMAQLHTT